MPVPAVWAVGAARGATRKAGGSSLPITSFHLQIDMEMRTTRLVAPQTAPGVRPGEQPVGRRKALLAAVGTDCLPPRSLCFTVTLDVRYAGSKQNNVSGCDDALTYVAMTEESSSALAGVVNVQYCL